MRLIRIKPKLQTFLLLIKGGLLAFCIACSPKDRVKSIDAESRKVSYPYRAVATVGMIADVLQNVAGDKASVKGLIGEGIDPHLYQPTRGDVVALSSADVIFYNGLKLEGKMGDVLSRMAGEGKAVFGIAETILAQGDYVLTDETQHADPHLWMDVKGWIRATKVISTCLTKFDVANKFYYDENAKRYIAQLQRLDAYASRVIDSIPKSHRVLVTAHDAFSYLGRAYGLEVKGIQGLSTESEAGVKDIEMLVAFLVERSIPAVFVETSVADKNVRALIEGAEARGHALRMGGALFSDAMGAPGTYEGTYIGMIDHNVTTIARALGGQVPEKGMIGKLNAF